MDSKSDYQIATTAGRRIKARIEVIDQSVILHSRGGATGGRPPRNEGYAEALVIICQRAMRNRDYLERILLDSAPARLLSEVQRVLIDKPELKDLDADTLAKTIRVRMRRFGQTDGVTGGNSTKQIRFDFSLPRSSIIQILALKKGAKASPEQRTEAEQDHDDGTGEVSRSAADVDRLDGFSATLQRLPLGEFSTADFVYEYQTTYPAEWLQIESQHGEGGKGAGQHRTVFTHVAHRLSALARQGGLYKLDYRPAPDWWGNAVVQFWSLTDPALTNLPEPAATDPEFREGSLRLKKHLQRERHWGLAQKKKAAYISTHGKLECERCRLDPVKLFGSSLGEAVIEVHHAEVSVAAMVEGHRTKLSDLQCLCANCHRLVHAEINASVKAAKLT